MASLVLPLLVLVSLCHASSLSLEYYDETCPRAELAVTQAVKQAASKDSTVPAALLRMHFHDCFIRGCDGSVLLDSTASNKAEKDGPPNLSLHSFFVIDNAKKAVETLCPGVVSCADILALAARDAVVLSGGPSWMVPLGRKDGRISRANETSQLPRPTFSFDQLKQSFAQRGLSTKDLLVLSGGHTLGFAHCSSFQNRIHGFDSRNDVDPSMDPTFAASLRKACPANNNASNAGATLDTTPRAFDGDYYRNLVRERSLLSSDAALLTHPKTKAFAMTFAGEQELFFKSFVKSMLRMSSLNGGDEVRLDCRVVR